LLDEEFIRFLRAKELQDAYTHEMKEAAKEVAEEQSRDHDSQALEKQRGLELDKWHRNVLNSCIFPFTETEMVSRTGYSFVRASPLHELKAPNFDFLIFNPKTRIALFGEAKGSLDDEGKVVSEAKTRMTVVEANRSYVNSSYLNSDAAAYEAVLGVQWTDANRLAKSVARRGGGIVVWQCGYDSRTEDFRLGIFVPGKDEGPVARTMMHQDDDLNRALSNVKTSNEYKTFFVESHVVAKMAILTIVDARKPDGIFAYEDLLELVKDEIGYLDQDTIRKEANLILTMGREIGFVKDEGANEFRINSRSKKAKNRFDEMKQKWIDWSLDRETISKIEEKRRALQADFTARRGSYGFLD